MDNKEPQPDASSSPDDRGSLCLQEAADVLGLHYMTVYRYVRTGRLPATKQDGVWAVERSILEDFAERRKGRTSSSMDAKDVSPPPEERLERALVAGDLPGVWWIVEESLRNGLSPAQLYFDSLLPALRRIGSGWAKGSYSIAQEHLASSVTLSVVGRLSHRFTRAGRKRGSIVLGCVSNDYHTIPVVMAEQLLTHHGFEVLSLGGSAPAECFAEASQNALDHVGTAVCATAPNNEEEIVRAVQCARASGPVFLGGAAVTPQVLEAAQPDATVKDLEDLVTAFVHLADRRKIPAFAKVGRTVPSE